MVSVNPPNFCLEEAMKQFAFVAGELKEASDALHKVEEESKTACDDLLHVKEEVDTISSLTENLVAIFHGHATRAGIKLRSFRKMALLKQFPRDVTETVLKMAKEFDSTTLQKFHGEIVKLATQVSQMNSRLHGTDLPSVSLGGKAAAFGGGAFLGAGVMGGAVTAEGFCGASGTLALGGTCLASSTTGVGVAVVLAAAIIGFIAWDLVKLYEYCKQKSVKKNLEKARSHCEEAFKALEALKERVKTAKTQVDLAADCLEDLGSSVETYAQLDDDRFNGFMADQLEGAIEELNKIIAALAPPRETRSSWLGPVTSGLAVALSAAALTTAVSSKSVPVR